MVKLTDVIAPSFYALHHDVAEGRRTHYWLKGGRGSTKSAFISLELLLSMMSDAAHNQHAHAIILRRYSNTLRESVYAQIQWAINALGVSEYWQASISPMRFTYTPTGQASCFVVSTMQPS